SVVALPITQFPIEIENAGNGYVLHWVLAGKGLGKIVPEISDGWNDFAKITEFNWNSDEKGRGSWRLPEGIRSGSASGQYYLRLKFTSTDEYISNVLELPDPVSG